VLSAGGGICGTCDTVGYLAKNAEIFSPPYLFAKDGSGQLASRPVISSAPTSVTYGSSFDVATPDAGNIAKVALVRLGAVTHSNNMEQRYIPLQFTAGAGTLHVTAPATTAVAPPGPYMLFILDRNGVPSVAKMTSIPIDQPPSAQITSPASGASYSFKSAISIQATATDDVAVSKVEFFQNATKLGEDTTAPYSYTWNGAGPGTYSLTVRATDSAGQTTTSAAVSVTVRKKGK
jgi:hypothetical protein